MKFLPFITLILFVLTNSCSKKTKLTPLTEDPVWKCLNEQDSSFANILLDLDSELRKVNYISEFNDYRILYKEVVEPSFDLEITQLSYNGQRDISIEGFLQNCKLIGNCVNKIYPDNLGEKANCGIPQITTDETEEVEGIGTVKLIKLNPEGKKHRVSTLYFATVMLIENNLISIDK